MSWNFDNYSVPLEQSQGYRRPSQTPSIDKPRKSYTFLPTQHETVGGYIQRLRNAVYELEQTSINAHINGKKMWYTHKTPSNCWICELSNIANYAVDIAIQTYGLDPNLKNYTFEINKNTQMLEITPPITDKN